MCAVSVAVEVGALSTELGSTLKATFDAMVQGDVAYSAVRDSQDASSPGVAPSKSKDGLGLRADGGVFAACSALSSTWYDPTCSIRDEVTAWLAPEHQLSGIYTNACTASTYAVIAAAESVSQGLMSSATAVSFRNIDSSTYALFESGKALSRSAISRPFSLKRDGLMLGAAGGALYMNPAPSNSVASTIVGYGISADGVDDVKPHPQGAGMSAAIQIAMQRAGISVDNLAFISPHGTATLANDQAEGVAIMTALGPRATEVPLFPSKAYIGHSLEATGLVEIALSIEALRRGYLPGYPHTDEEGFLDGPSVASTVIELDGSRQYALSLNAAFGGSNVAVVLKAGSNET